jgi:hypothetical protein
MPDVQVNTNTPGVITTNIAYVVVDEVTYASGGRWGNWANGGGSSLELIDPRANHRLASNWADSDETAKAPWTTIEATGVLDLGESYRSGQTTTPINRLEVLGLGEECLMMEVTEPAEQISSASLKAVSPLGAAGVMSGQPETSEGFPQPYVRASSRVIPPPIVFALR